MGGVVIQLSSVTFRLALASLARIAWFKHSGFCACSQFTFEIDIQFQSIGPLPE
jgi:hypothetical protein